MLVYLCNALSECTINLEKLESIIAKRFSMYNSFDLQYDTEEFKKYDKIAQLVMSFIAFDYSVFNEFFLQGESKLFINKLEKKRLLEIKEELSTLLLNLKYLSQVVLTTILMC